MQEQGNKVFRHAQMIYNLLELVQKRRGEKRLEKIRRGEEKKVDEKTGGEERRGTYCALYQVNINHCESG